MTISFSGIRVTTMLTRSAAVLEGLDDQPAKLTGSETRVLRRLRSLDRSETEEHRRQRLAGLVVQLAREPSPLRFLRLHGAPKGVA